MQERGPMEVRGKAFLSRRGSGKGREKHLSPLADGWDLSGGNKCCDANCCFWTWILGDLNWAGCSKGCRTRVPMNTSKSKCY